MFQKTPDKLCTKEKAMPPSPTFNIITGTSITSAKQIVHLPRD